MNNQPVGGPGITVKVVNNRTFERTAIRTRMIMFGEPLDTVVREYAQGQIGPNAILCLSEKLVSICENNVRHIDSVRDTWLARLIVRYVTRYPNDIGFSHPKKMQVAIDCAGTPRIVIAVLIGGLTRLLLKRRGDFYRIAGHGIAEIDGFNPEAMKPFDEYAMLPPRDPVDTCRRLSEEFGCACYIIDGNNINVKVVGMSPGLEDRGFDAATARLVMLDNPMGQRDELTPIFVLHERPTAEIAATDG
ncbi:MAG: hypothetical protein KGJ62_05060 [Armatimonadetes bacterium]|nr:hypothetical protein [Armatimonadota bacterium]MDE2205431.1 hypothetical protein [Armatimonadota bacterium]